MSSTEDGASERSPLHDRLLPLAPIIVTIWNDGALSDDEMVAMRARMAPSAWLSATDVRAISEWLDPDAPPTPRELGALVRRLEGSAIDERACAGSLTELGLALWSAMSGEGAWNDPDARAWLGDVESALGVLGAEAACEVLGIERPSSKGLARRAPGDPVELLRFLDRPHGALRADVRALLAEPELTIQYGLPTDVYRARVLDAVRLLAERGYGRYAFPTAYGGRDDPAGSVAIFETLAYGDLSVLVKYGVQFGLFGGSVHQLGTERHHERYLADIGSLDLPGCYAMTETGHGSNVRDLETTARYDADTRELVVHTPTEQAGKDWIGNAAAHGRVATVFARLVVGEVDHGVHAMLVPIRDDTGGVLEGVRIEDRGRKVGLNGVDNGRIWFENVRVPVDSLLDRFARIDTAGRYHSPIPSAGRRFFTMLRTLVAGRVSIASASVSAAKVALTIAVRYAAGRRQFGPQGAAERPILEYTAMQRELAPRLATTLGLHFAARALQRRFSAPGGDDAEIEGLAAGLKAYASDQCVETVQACREACGGQGYLAENRFAALKEDTDIFTTFEGANLVLYQLVAKGLLSRFRDEMGDLNFWRAMRVLGERAETTLTELNPLVTRRTDPDHLCDPDFHRAALTYRHDRLLRSAAMRLRARLRDGTNSFDAVNEVQDHLVSLARAFVERVVFEALADAVAEAPNPGISELLGNAAALFALSRIEADRGWFLEAGYIEGAKSEAIRARVNVLCAEVSECAEYVVDAFGIPEAILPPLVRRATK